MPIDIFPERHVLISLNVSPRQFFDNAFIETLQDLKFEGPHLVERLEVEITESTMVHDINHAVSVMCDIGALGYRLSIDDFGTGYSSIAQLAKLPVHTLKVDKTFLDELGISESSTTVIRSIIDLGINLGLTVTAEGVETKAQADYLRRNRCHRLQGYLFGRPMEKISPCTHCRSRKTFAMGVKKGETPSRRDVCEDQGRTPPPMAGR